MLEKILKLQNWARLAGFVTIFVSVIVCSFFYAISYPPPPSTASVGQRNQSSDSAEQQLSATEKRGTRSAPLAVEIVPSKEGAPESEYGKEILEKASNERGLTVATWVLAFATFFLFAAASVQVALFVWQLDLIRESLTDAKKAADAAEKSASAAKLNAQALIDAEAAQMYLIIQNSNIERMYQLGGTYYNSLTMHASSSSTVKNS